MVRYLLQAALLAVLVTIVLAWPFYAWRGGVGLACVGVAAGLCVLGAAIAHLVGGLVARLNPGPEAGAQGAQLATAVRMLLTLALSLPVFLTEVLPTLPFGIALVVHYLAQMALEVFVSLRELSQNPSPSGTPARSTQPEEDLPSGSQRTSTAPDGPGANES